MAGGMAAPRAISGMRISGSNIKIHHLLQRL
nr:MAG TPA: hypothetical protein [Caudoviricetes sp.]